MKPLKGVNPMKKVNLAYGRTGLEINIPDDAIVIEPHHIEGINNECGATRSAMRKPLGSLPLRDMVKDSDTVAIVISDITRPTPNQKLVPWIIEELSHVPKKNFIIINGLGTHRANTKEELVCMLGQDIVNSIKIENHDAFNDDKLVFVGRNTYGSDVYLNKAYVQATFKIVIGFIEPHFFAGFSGGPKGIQPGIAGIKTILDFHNAKMIGHPNSTWGMIEGNILQDAATQNCLMAKPDFMLNVTLNNKKEITNIFAGDVIKAHRKGCEFVKQQAMYEINQAVDIVITTNAGYPLDQNLYQTVKGMSAAAQIVRPGGAIISASECSDGIPEHGNYAKILQMCKTSQELLDMINNPEFSMFDQWQVQVQAMVQNKADCYLYSTLDDDTVRKAKFIPIRNVEETLGELIKKYSPNPRVAIMPFGPLTIPYIRQ